MLSYRELVKTLIDLQIPSGSPVIVHADMQRLEEVRGGTDTILSALHTMTGRLVFPAFTTRTMVVPLVGPESNGLEYGTGLDENLDSTSFHSGLPVDNNLGQLAEAFRLLPGVLRSTHPILSFCSLNLEQAVLRQSLENPYAPIEYLLQAKGWVLLMGTSHRHNTTIHYAEKLAGRRQFTRWALAGETIVECPYMPGCPDGFDALDPLLSGITRETLLGECRIRAIPVNKMIHAVKSLLADDPAALTCDDPLCNRCAIVRGAPVQELP